MNTLLITDFNLFLVLKQIAGFGFMFFVLCISSIYLIGLCYAFIVNLKHFNQSKSINYHDLLHNPYSPGISLIAPAFNESLTIIDNVRSLLSLHYAKMEVIVVNDGSKDDTMQKMIKAFDLYPVKYNHQRELTSKKIRAIYHSGNKAINHLIVIDKENGGKSDALNAGISLAQYPIVGCMDVDSILMTDSLLKLVKPFVDDDRVIATGGSVRIANSCEIIDGNLVKVKMPKGFFERFQVLEYLRAFLLGRMTWSGINGLVLISGAVGLFKKENIIRSGGYRTDVVGEDIELIIRLRKEAYLRNEPHKIVYIADPLCWTEAPSSHNILSKQRNRWNRGAFEALMIHKDMLFNPKYGIVGMFSLPYWLFFEWMSPIVEVLGLVLALLLVAFNLFNFQEFFLLTAAAYCFVVFISTATILIEELTFQQYTTKIDFYKLLMVALIEPIVYHPLVVWWSLTGIWDKLLKKNKGWGVMTRQGFSTSPASK